MSDERDAALVACLFAIDPHGLGGVCVRSAVQPARDQWLEGLKDLLPPGVPLRKVPCNVPDGRLLGGLDLVATLQANRPVAERGILAEADGGVVIIAMAERLTAQTAGRLGAALDTGEISMPREGVMLAHRAEVGVVLLDEGIGEDEHAPIALLDRLAFLLDFNGFSLRSVLTPEHQRASVIAARALLPRVRYDPDILEALCATALALGAGSPRVTLLALRTALAAAALDGRTRVTHEDAVLAARVVLCPRATRLPQPAQDSAASEPASPATDPAPRAKEPPAQATEPPPSESPASGSAVEPPPGAVELPPDAAESPPGDEQSRRDAAAQPPAPPPLDATTLTEMLVGAAQAAIPAGLLARLRTAAAEERRASAGGFAGGRVGHWRRSGLRGRPAGVVAGTPAGGKARLNVIETLRAAAAWQRLRGRSDGRGRVRVLPEDFRVTKYQQRTQTLTIFVVDASGSSALNRLAEAKGAVELLLADCYVRRDQVAVIGFRGKRADLLLAPTRSLVRAKRSLAGLPGGGGTPLAAALQAAGALALSSQRRGETPTLVVLTDGRANVARDGTPGRELAHAQALVAAGAVARAGIAALFVDTAPRPSQLARDIAAALRAPYIALPFANARALNAVIQAAHAPSLRQ
jgi:magnesium chelatase subunit D